MYDQAYYEGALQQFQKAVDADPRNADAYYNLGATHHQLAKLHNRDGDYAQAESYYHHASTRVRTTKIAIGRWPCCCAIAATAIRPINCSPAGPSAARLCPARGSSWPV